jgi:hypothetical protein
MLDAEPRGLSSKVEAHLDPQPGARRRVVAGGAVCFLGKPVAAGLSRARSRRIGDETSARNNPCPLTPGLNVSPDAIVAEIKEAWCAQSG